MILIVNGPVKKSPSSIVLQKGKLMGQLRCPHCCRGGRWGSAPLSHGLFSYALLGKCKGWFQTMDCNSHGPPDHEHDKPCNATLASSGMSGCVIAMLGVHGVLSWQC